MYNDLDYMLEDEFELMEEGLEPVDSLEELARQHFIDNYEDYQRDFYDGDNE